MTRPVRRFPVGYFNRWFNEVRIMPLKPPTIIVITKANAHIYPRSGPPYHA